MNAQNARNHLTVHEAGHATVVSVLAKCRLDGIDIHHDALQRRYHGKTQFTQFVPDTSPAFHLQRMLIYCAGFMAETIAGLAPSVTNMRDDLQALMTAATSVADDSRNRLWLARHGEVALVRLPVPQTDQERQVMINGAAAVCGQLLCLNRTRLDLYRSFLERHVSLDKTSLASLDAAAPPSVNPLGL